MTLMEKPRSARFSWHAVMPLLNLMLLLLCVTALGFLVMHRGQLGLPTRFSCGCGFHGNSRVLELRVTSAGVLWDGKQPVKWAELPGMLAHHREASTHPSVLITGSDHAVFGTVVRLLDQVRQAGIETVTVSSSWTPE